MITKLDLEIKYHKETGNAVGNLKIIGSGKNRKAYFKWIEEKYLEHLNDEVNIKNLFNEAISN